MYFRGFSYPACGPILIWLVPSALDLAPFNSTPGSAYGPSGSGGQVESPLKLRHFWFLDVH